MPDHNSSSFVSAKMVAERAGVSRSAVSRTFTDGASVSLETRRKVLAAAEALGYHVNHLARQLRERSNIVCLIVSDMTTPVRSQMLDSLTRKLQAAGKITMVLNTESDEDSVGRALKLTLHYRADATVVLSGTPSSSLVKTALGNGQQVVLINRDDRFDGCYNVSIDNALAARDALYLLQRAGCGRIALLTSSARTPSLLERELHFLQSAAKLGLTVNVVEAVRTDYRSGYEAGRQTFARSGAPDGIFCVTDLLALGFMDAARHEFKLTIPQDLCVIGFDNIEQSGWEAYQLTTFEQSVEKMAAEVVKLLSLPEIEGGQGPEAAIIVEPQPVWRQTVRPKGL